MERPEKNTYTRRGKIFSLAAIVVTRATAAVQEERGKQA